MCCWKFDITIARNLHVHCRRITTLEYTFILILRRMVRTVPPSTLMASQWPTYARTPEHIRAKRSAQRSFARIDLSLNTSKCWQTLCPHTNTHARTHTHTHTAPLQLVEEFVMGDLTEPLMTYELRDLKMGPQVHARVECVIPIPPFEMLCSNRVRHVPNHLFYCFIRTALCSRCRSPSTRIQRPSASGKLGASHTCTRSPGICVSNSVLSLNKASPSSLATTGTVCIRIL